MVSRATPVMITDFTSKDLCLINTNYFGFDSQGHDSPLLSPETSVTLAVSSFIYHSASNIGANTKVSTNIKVDSKTDNKSLMAKAQKIAVRKLLFHLIFEKMKGWLFTYAKSRQVNLLQVKGLSLLEGSYPYRLLPFNYYICFTHSANKVACAIHTEQVIGIDLEVNSVSMKVAQRYYTSEEKNWLSQLDTHYLPQAVNLLWLLKEASIKQSKTNNANLLSGLKESKLFVAQKLIPMLANNQHNPTNISKDATTQSYCHQDSTDLTNITTYVYIAAESLVAIW